jgi:uncharacterized RDD family membrane protein YckC
MGATSVVADEDQEATLESEFDSEETFDEPQIAIPRESLPRYIAALVDWALQMPLGVLVIKSLPASWAVLQLPLVVVIFLGYFLLFEGLFGRTPGKLLTGLVVVQFDGRKCTWRQAWTRTYWRLLEVNPLLLGAIPAAIAVVRSPYHQRLGDHFAKTLVVPRSSLS